MFNFLCFRSVVEKKHLRKKTLSLFLEKLMKATKFKKNGQIARKVNEGDKI